jgi:hypothetical protein
MATNLTLALAKSSAYHAPVAGRSKILVRDPGGLDVTS